MGDKTLTPREIAQVVLNIKDLAYNDGYNKALSDVRSRIDFWLRAELQREDDDPDTRLVDIFGSLIQFLDSKKA
jgi:hypothetical protein